ncbi:MAG: O-antigen ligase family protein [Betaproteobacteria bacterium]|nr:O-antigen ligase family protein [Betaproteobacteria bacterium]
MLASRDPPLLLLAAAAAAIAVAAWLCAPRRLLRSPIAAAVTAFAVVALGSVWIWGSRYTPAAVYHMGLLVGAYALGRGFAQRGRSGNALAILVAVALAVSAYGLWQRAWLGAARADAWFETPNLMAAFVNLALAPLAVLVLLRGPRFLRLAALTGLSAALAATQSRGGALGLAGAAATTALLLIGGGWRPATRTIAALGASFALGYGLAMLAPQALALKGATVSEAAQVATAEAVSPKARLDSAASRLELYALAANAARARPLAGSGYLDFGRLFDREQARVPSYEPGMATLFVHDDYLQVLLELGLLGLLPFLAFTALPPLLGYFRKAMLQPGSSAGDAYGIAVLAGLASMATHALVDFPFYVPGTLAAYGLLLGIADEWLHPAPVSDAPRSPGALARVLRTALAALAAYALAIPAAAEGCAVFARERVQRGDVADAVYWLQVGRNFDPRDWRRHWQLAALLAQQASLLRDPRLAQLAAQAYEAGMRADPGDVHNLLGWLTLERTFGPRLAHPAPRAQLLARMNEAVALAPLDTAVRVERVLMLRYLGEARQARETAQALLRDFPGDPALRRLVAEQG